MCSNSISMFWVLLNNSMCMLLSDWVTRPGKGVSSNLYLLCTHFCLVCTVYAETTTASSCSCVGLEGYTFGIKGLLSLSLCFACSWSTSLLLSPWLRCGSRTLLDVYPIVPMRQEVRIVEMISSMSMFSFTWDQLAATSKVANIVILEKMDINGRRTA